MSQEYDNRSSKRVNYVGLCLAIGLIIGGGVGLALGNIVFAGGGMVIGLAIGTVIERQQGRNP
jgi:hypothetical protein